MDEATFSITENISVIVDGIKSFLTLFKEWPLNIYISASFAAIAVGFYKKLKRS